MKFPIYPKRKADNISHGIFLVLLGFLFYTDQWWPGILFALGFTLAIRQYLTGRRLDFFITLIAVALLGLITLAGHGFSLLFPILFIGMGVYLIIKECLSFKQTSSDSTSPPDSSHLKDD